MNTDEILKSIALTGNANSNEAKVKPLIVEPKNIDAVAFILDKSSGSPRIKHKESFRLILSLPGSLTGFNPFNVRCCLCGSVISYPAWHKVRKLAVNQFHYFICAKGTEVKFHV